MIKLIAIDLDGTMYNSEQKITPAVKESITLAAENQIQPLIVTGRGRLGAEKALRTLEMDFPYISSAGSLLRTGLNGETIHAWTFHNHDELMQVINYATRHKLGLIAESDRHGSFWYGPDTMLKIMDPLTVTEARSNVRTHNPEADLNLPLLKLTITGEKEHLEIVSGILEENCPSLHGISSGPQFFDITAQGVNKGTALKTYAENAGYLPVEIAAIGDQAIDLHMLRYSGLSIAMSNAVAMLQAEAEWIAPSNNEDGVAWAIQKIIERNALEKAN